MRLRGSTSFLPSGSGSWPAMQQIITQSGNIPVWDDVSPNIRRNIMPKQQRFITDEMWQQMNYRKLVDLSQDEEMAKLIVSFLDENPDIRQDLAGIYFKAKDTLASSKN